MKQGQGRGIKGPAQVEEGNSINIEIGVDGVDHVLVSDGQPGSKPREFPVGPGGKVTIPAQPGWRSGTVLLIFSDTIPVRSIQVEVTPPQL